MPVVWWKLLLGTVASLGALQALWHSQHDKINLRLMKFFRDLGRYKALQRRRGDADNSKGLLAFLASDVDPLQDLLDLDAAADDQTFDAYPNESIEQWHQRLGLER